MITSTTQEGKTLSKNCKIDREQDEYVCNYCGIRWGIDEEKPETACTQDAVNKHQMNRINHLVNKKSPD